MQRNSQALNTILVRVFQNVNYIHTQQAVVSVLCCNTREMNDTFSLMYFSVCIVYIYLLLQFSTNQILCTVYLHLCTVHIVQYMMHIVRKLHCTHSIQTCSTQCVVQIHCIVRFNAMCCYLKLWTKLRIVSFLYTLFKTIQRVQKFFFIYNDSHASYTTNFVQHVTYLCFFKDVTIACNIHNCQ